VGRTSRTPRRRTVLLAVPVALLIALIPSMASPYPKPGTFTGDVGGEERQQETAAGLDATVRTARESAAEKAAGGPSGTDLVRDT
jgi:hypothetical protein